MVVAAVVIGLAALSSVTKRGGGSETGKCSGGTCCPTSPGLNVWSTNSWEQAEAANGRPTLTAEEAVTNRAQ